MAQKKKEPMIHCTSCNKAYSATYKFCPFCGGSQQPTPAADEEYEFDGQIVFDYPEEDSPPAKGGKRLAGGGAQRPAPPPPVNWPRVITFVCSLVIIAAALVIVFTVVYPHLRKTETPPPSADPSPIVTSDPNSGALEDGLLGMTLDTVDLNLAIGQSRTLQLTLNPVDWNGTVTWSSSDETCATVDKQGTVTNVNTSGVQRRAVITASAGNMSITCTVYCQSDPKDAPVPSSTPEQPSQTPTPEPPVQSGNIADGTKATIFKAANGLRVRSGPGTSYDVQASLKNGSEITVVSYAGDGWYKIRYNGSGGAKTGYIMEEYISVT